MSERYGKCKRCQGQDPIALPNKLTGALLGEPVECMACFDTGFSGDALDYLQQQADEDFEKDSIDDLMNDQPWSIL